MKTALIISIIIFILPLGYLAKDYGLEFLAVDSCLDFGGSYDYEKYKCDKMENHPYTAYSKRKKALISTCLSLSIAGLASSLLMSKRKRKYE